MFSRRAAGSCVSVVVYEYARARVVAPEEVRTDTVLRSTSSLVGARALQTPEERIGGLVVGC